MLHTYDFEGAVKGPARVAFGSFDGMHLGHQAVIRQLYGYETLTPVVLSLYDEEAPVVYTEGEKEYLLRSSGVEVMVSVPFAQVKAMTGETFVCDVLVQKLLAKSVVVGEDVRFGSDGLGTEELRALGEKYGFSVTVIPTIQLDGEAVTTAALKKAIADGSFSRLSALLGHTYIMQGTVVHGKAAGRKHGMPTANLGVAKNKIFPPHGVYGTLSYMDGAFFRGMTNIGLRPSDDDIPIPTVETFLLNFDRDIYDKPITLEVHAYIRGVKKFSGGLDEVRRQIDQDIEDVRAYMDKVILDMRK